MARSTNKKTAAEDIVSLDDLADISGLTVEELRTGGAAFFRRLGTTKSKLIGALVAASTASGANPQKFIHLISNLAEALEPAKKGEGKLVHMADHRK